MKHFAIIGAGMAGVVCARTLVQAGHRVTLFEKSRGFGGRMATRHSPFGTFDHGAQYFTVRDARFRQAIDLTAAGLCKPWSATAVRVLDPVGHVLEAALPGVEPHWVPVPGMSALVKTWAEPLAQAGMVHLQTRVQGIERGTGRSPWRVQAEDAEGRALACDGFDGVVLAIPAPQARDLLRASGLSDEASALEDVRVDPCWTLMVAYPQAVQPGLITLGPQWNVARSTHHRMAWMARESSKPGREKIERWTLQASASWSMEHVQDSEDRVTAKMLKAFAELSGIRVEPAHAQAHRWLYAKTRQALGVSHVWQARQGLGLCGDWCLGHRVEDAFVSGLELALHMVRGR